MTEKASAIRSAHKVNLLSSTYNRFVLDKCQGRIHDRSCPKIDLIPDTDFSVLASFSEHNNELSVAPCCFRRVMIRMGIPDYAPTRNMEEMVALFDRLGATDEQLRVLFKELKSVFLYQTPKQCILRVKDDSWKIIIDDNGQLQLLHNSYRVNRLNYSRQFNRGYNGFHEQNLRYGRRADFNNVFRVITEYSWADHIDYLKEKDQQNEDSIKKSDMK